MAVKPGSFGTEVQGRGGEGEGSQDGEHDRYMGEGLVKGKERKEDDALTGCSQNTEVALEVKTETTVAVGSALVPNRVAWSVTVGC